MPLDASIPLSYKPTTELMGPKDLLSLKDLSVRTQSDQIDLQNRQKDQQQKVALSQILQNPQSTGPDGLLTPQALSAVTRVKPEFGLALMQQQDKISLDKFKRDERRDSVKASVLSSRYEAYQRHLQGGKSPQDAERLANEEATESVKQMAASGSLSSSGFNEQGVDALMRFPPMEQSRVAVQMLGGKIGEPKAPLSDIGKLRADKDAGRISEKDYNAEVARKTAATSAMVGRQGFEGKNGALMAALAERGVALPAGFRSAQQQVGLLDSLWKRNPELTADQIADKVKSGQIDLANVRKAGQVAAGIAGKVAYAENEILQTIPLVQEASAKLPRGQFVPYNKLKQMGEASFSDPNLAEFRMYMTSLSNAYDMLAARGGTDVEKRAESRKNFDTAASPEALERVLQAVMKEAKASGRAAQAAMKPPGEKEVEKGVSKSGRPMHKEDGKWVYD